MARAKEYKLPMYGDWYALTIWEHNGYGLTKRTSGSKRNTWPAKVFKSEAMASMVQCKNAPYLHSILIGEYNPRAYENNKPKGTRVAAFVVTYVWDTRQIVDVQQIDNDKQIAAILDAGIKKSMLATDNHEPLKGIEKVQAAYAKVIERNQQFNDDNSQPMSPMVTAVLQALGKDPKRPRKGSGGGSPDLDWFKKAKSVEAVGFTYVDGKAKIASMATYSVKSFEYHRVPHGRGCDIHSVSFECYTKNGHLEIIILESKLRRVEGWFDGTIIQKSKRPDIDGVDVYAYTFK